MVERTGQWNLRSQAVDFGRYDSGPRHGPSGRPAAGQMLLVMIWAVRILSLASASYFLFEYVAFSQINKQEERPATVLLSKSKSGVLVSLCQASLSRNQEYQSSRCTINSHHCTVVCSQQGRN